MDGSTDLVKYLHTSGFKPTRHPNISARSPTTMTMRPIIIRETTKQGHPPSSPGGGITAKINLKKKNILFCVFFIFLFHLKSKCDEVHDVVSCSGRLNISAIDDHGVFELLGPGLIVDSKLVNISICH